MGPVPINDTSFQVVEAACNEDEIIISGSCYVPSTSSVHTFGWDIIQTENLNRCFFRKLTDNPLVADAYAYAMCLKK